MYGGRITGEDRSSLSQYIGIGVAVLLTAGAVYFLVLSQNGSSAAAPRKFDPNRPVPSDAVLRERLKPEQYHVVRENGSEVAFQNEYWDNDRAGIYVDVITGDPLFTSVDKYDSGVGVPSFSQPISYDSVVEQPDSSDGMQRIEVHAKRSNAHLGHLFGDPKSPTGRRYSIQSAALHFVPKEDMAEQGYERYLPLLDKKPKSGS